MVAVILIVFLVEDHKQNDIEIYNLAHLAFGFLGHIIVLGAFELQNEVATAIVGHQLLKGTAELSLVSMPRSSRIPSSNRKMRFLVQFTAILFDVAIILMCLYLNWTPEFSALPGLNKTGLYPCIPASYPESFKLPPFDLGTFLQGDVDYATIYHYGLPLKDGILGGFGAWPLYSPKEAKVFKVEAKGYIFAINVVCGKPTFVNKKIFNQTIDGTFFKTGSQVEMPNSFFSVVYVAYPAFSHNWVGYEDQPMQQACNIQLSSGGGRITTEMVVDEWEMIVLGKISNITVIDTDGSSKTAILDFHHKDTAESSDMMYAAEFEDAFFYSPSSPDYENVTHWVYLIKLDSNFYKSSNEWCLLLFTRRFFFKYSIMGNVARRNLSRRKHMERTRCSSWSLC